MGKILFSRQQQRITGRAGIRSARGGMFVIVLAGIMVLAMVAVVLGWLLILCGGVRESQNAVDSGSLNLAKQVIKSPYVRLNTSDTEAAFAQVAEQKNGEFIVNLNNINRLSAELMLIQTNCAAMTAENSAGPSVKIVSQPLQTALERIQGKLAEQLAARANVMSHYEDIANANSVRMLQTCSNNDIRVYQTDYTIGYVDRGGMSNVHIADKQIPASFRTKWDSQKTSWAEPIDTSEDKQYYLRGYINDIKPLDSEAIYFVTLKEGRNIQELSSCQPHLISQGSMKENQDTGRLAWHSPVPNAFGITMNTGTKYIDPLSTTPSSSVVRSLQPSQGFYAQIPHGFIRIQNLPPQKASNSVDEPHKDDVFNFLSKNSLVYAKGPTEHRYQKESDQYIDNILKALKNKQIPKEADYKALKKEATLQEAMQIQSKSDKIDNHTYKTFPPELPKEIGEAYEKYVPQPGNPQSEQLHCYEAACFALLAARTTGAKGDPFSLKAGQSGIAKFQPQRSALSPTQKQFTKSMTLAEIFSNPNSSVIERLKERCYQIFPTFSGNVSDIAGWNSQSIPMGSSFYIYWDGNLDQQTGRPQGTLRLASSSDIGWKAPWISAQINSVPEGKAAAVDCNVISISPKGNGGLDLPGDWSYEQPFDTYKGDQNLVVRNTAIFCPASGVNGLLGEIDLSAQFGATAQDPIGVNPGFSTHDIEKTKVSAPMPLKVKGEYSGPS